MSTEERLASVERGLAVVRETVAMLRARDEEALRVREDIFTRLLPELSERIGRVEALLQAESQKTSKFLGGIIVVAALAPFLAKVLGA